ncbi:MAG TPA: hypothetical protein VMV19_15910 [Xanthobacteraceae bacterium]|nr:hypothetical protein [Xanthobacteraceae bacterium]
MSNSCRVLSVAVAVGLLLTGWPSWADETPQLLPTRDVDITYDVTRPQQPKIRQRVRWLAAEHLERVDGPDKATTIFDRGTHEITLLVPASRTYRKLNGEARRPPAPEAGAALKRGDVVVVAGLHCTDWSWTGEDIVVHAVCLTPDGVLLRLVIDGQTIMQARSVSYGPQHAELFQVPPDYTPALAPEGGSATD